MWKYEKRPQDMTRLPSVRLRDRHHSVAGILFTLDEQNESDHSRPSPSQFSHFSADTQWATWKTATKWSLGTMDPVMKRILITTPFVTGLPYACSYSCPLNAWDFLLARSQHPVGSENFGYFPLPGTYLFGKWWQVSLTKTQKKIKLF